MEAQGAELCDALVRRVLLRELTTAGVDVRVEKDAGDDEYGCDQRSDDERRPSERERGAQ
jgi:hypothetical protein